ncbi:hypothetical protein NMS90_004464 [Vibrio alginolyticus]|nr:hypothetical protein [Vibrio alginolyticus]
MSNEKLSQHSPIGLFKNDELKTVDFYLEHPIVQAYSIVSETDKHIIFNLTIVDNKDKKYVRNNITICNQTGKIYDPDFELICHNNPDDMDIGINMLDYFHILEVNDLYDLSEFGSYDEILDEYPDYELEDHTVEDIWLNCQHFEDGIIERAVSKVFEAIKKNNSFSTKTNEDTV